MSRVVEGMVTTMVEGTVTKIVEGTVIKTKENISSTKDGIRGRWIGR